MEVTTIVYIVIAFVLGIIITCICVFKKKSTSNKAQFAELYSENEGLKQKLAEAEEKAKTAESNYSDKANEVKTQYEILLKEANGQIEQLDQQLKNT